MDIVQHEWFSKSLEIRNLKVQGGGIQELRNLAQELHLYEGYEAA
jgi:hypothetical protein